MKQLLTSAVALAALATASSAGAQSAPLTPSQTGPASARAGALAVPAPPGGTGLSPLGRLSAPNGVEFGLRAAAPLGPLPTPMTPAESGRTAPASAATLVKTASTQPDAALAEPASALAVLPEGPSAAGPQEALTAAAAKTAGLAVARNGGQALYGGYIFDGDKVRNDADLLEFSKSLMDPSIPATRVAAAAQSLAYRGLGPQLGTLIDRIASEVKPPKRTLPEGDYRDNWDKENVDSANRAALQAGLGIALLQDLGGRVPVKETAPLQALVVGRLEDLTDAIARGAYHGSADGAPDERTAKTEAFDNFFAPFFALFKDRPQTAQTVGSALVHRLSRSSLAQALGEPSRLDDIRGVMAFALGVAFLALWVSGYGFEYTGDFHKLSAFLHPQAAALFSGVIGVFAGSTSRLLLSALGLAVALSIALLSGVLAVTLAIAPIPLLTGVAAAIASLTGLSALAYWLGWLAPRTYVTDDPDTEFPRPGTARRSLKKALNRISVRWG